MSKSILVLGSDHLVSRIKKLAAEKGYSVKHFSDLHVNSPEDGISTISSTRNLLADIDLNSFAITYILFESDKDNLEMVITMMALHPDLRMATSLFNENLRPHLQAASKNLQVINPAKVASQAFIDAIEFKVERKRKVKALPKIVQQKINDTDSFLKVLIVAFLFVIVGATLYFHYVEHLPWIDSIYFVVVTCSTVGYGDISLQSSAGITKLVGIILILSSTIFIWLIFSLIVDRMIKRREQQSLGRKVYNYKNHVIVCGLGRLGYFIAEGLHFKGHKVIIIEENENSPNLDYFRNLKVDVYNGDAKLPKVLQDVGAENCKALIAATNDDYANIEIGLNARYFQPEMKLVLRIFDDSMAKIIKEKFDIHLTQSMSYIAAQKFVELLENKEN
jgi:voltage-gated potassium channel Kch